MVWSAAGRGRVPPGLNADSMPRGTPLDAGGGEWEALDTTGGKKIRLPPCQVITSEKLPAAGKGAQVEFTSVLLLRTDGDMTVAPADLRRAKVTGEVIGERKGRKITVVKFKRRKNYRRTRGHRQVATTVRITKIEV